MQYLNRLWCVVYEYCGFQVNVFQSYDYWILSLRHKRQDSVKLNAKIDNVFQTSLLHSSNTQHIKRKKKYISKFWDWCRPVETDALRGQMKTNNIFVNIIKNDYCLG